MKLLAVFFVLGLAIASAVPLHFDDIESEIDQISDELGDEFILYAEGGLGQRLRERLEGLIEKIKNAFDEGKGVNGNLMKKAQDFYEKFKNLGFELSEKFKSIWEDLVSKVSKNAVEHPDDLDDDLFELSEGGLGQRLKERLEGLIERIKKAFDEGKGVNGNLMKKAEDFYQKFKNLGFELSEKFKSIFEDLRSKVSKNSVENAEFNIRDIFRRLRDLIKNNLDADKLKEQIEKFFGKKSELANQLLEMLKTKGEKAKNKILELIDRVLGDKEETFFADAGEGNIASRIRERLENLITRLKKNFDDGKGVKGNVFKKVNDIYEKFKNLGFELSEKFKSIFEDLRSKVGRGRSVENADFNFFEIFKKLKQLIKDKVDVDKLKEQVEKLFGKGSEMAEQLLNLLKTKGEKGKNKLLELIDRILGEKEEKRSIKEIYERIRDYFKDLNIELKERFTKFGEYVKEQYQKVLDKTKPKIENVKRIAKEFLDDTRKMSKDMGEQALEFFREYKKDLGLVYDDIVDKVREITKKKEEKRSIKEIYERIRDYFKDLNIELKEKFTKFGEYVKEQYQKVLDKTKPKIENIKRIAKEFLDDTRKISKDMGEEALEFFREYKKDLGHVYDDLVEKVREITKKKEEKRSIKEIYERIRDYFKDLNIELKEKFTKFGEYVKEQYQKVLDKSKTKAENIKRIAKEFLDDSRKISKDMANEALDFFREYKKDLGLVYDDLVEKVREILKRDD